jgi:poly-gamma-glutamate synthesis protein (capsule biosynthesis protein)
MMRALLLAFALLLPSLHPAAAQSAPGGVSRTLHLTFIGDIMAHDVNHRMEDYRDIYRGVEEVFLRDDLTFANLEFPVDPTRPESGYPRFNGTPAYVRAAIESGVDVFSLANNHAFDGGLEGLLQTLRFMAGERSNGGAPLLTSGIRGNPRSPFLPRTLLVGGVRVGFIAVTQFLNQQYGGRYVNVVDYADESAAAEFERFVRETSRCYDLFIVSYHGDEEYVEEPSAKKRSFFRGLLEAGARIVFGHHPHVVQGFEVGRSGAADGLIMYSMGNFVSGMTRGLDPVHPDPLLAATGEGYALSVEVRCAPTGCTVSSVHAVPIANYLNARGEIVVARLGELADGAIGLTKSWKSYYASRLERMRRFLALSPSEAQAAGR